MMPSLAYFKAYDVRGKLGDELDEGIAYRIGRAYAQHLNYALTWKLEVMPKLRRTASANARP